MSVLLCRFRLGGEMMERLTIDEVIEHCSKTCDMTERIAKARGHELESIESNQFWEHYQVRAWLKELKQYKDLDEQGLLLRLPCKVGDSIYSVIEDGLTIIELKFSLDFYVRRKNDIGKTVFLTQAEAERKLKEMESD